MIVERYEFPVKPGRTTSHRSRELLIEAVKNSGAPHAVRVYTSSIGRDNVHALEFEFESFEERERFWADWSATPEADEWIDEHSKLVEHGITNEIWTLRFLK
jgi:hypothetical protein